jgi:hypothetical protein
MPALDSCHFQIVRALQKEGWQVAPRPKYIYDENVTVFIDIEALRSANGNDENNRRIYIEVKCFPDPGSTRELYIAIGQYLVYQTVLASQTTPIPIYLAIPINVYDGTFNSTVRKTVKEHKIKLVVVDLETETIVQWLE